jgi:hypothetical protein
MEKLYAYYRELAEYVIQKYKPTKWYMLRYLSVIRKRYWGFYPYHLLSKQIRKCMSLGAHGEDVYEGVLRQVLTILFPEFNQDFYFFIVYSNEYEFWRLNFIYYKKRKKTIFEEQPFHSFDWENFYAGISKINQQQMKPVLQYEAELMQKAKDAVASL